jgi:hypothetical protein
MTNHYRVSILIADDNDADDVRATVQMLLSDHDFCVRELSVIPTSNPT